MEIKIKEASKKEFVAFGGGGKTLLGDRTQDDLQKLALMALQSKNKNLLRHFDGELPSIADLQAARAKQMVNKGPEAQKAQPETEKQKEIKA